jgi:multidrug efflux pump subunit AcrA (membrane-fusion protein)
MMASRSPRGIQGIAEGGLKGLSALRAGKQEIKKSEAYLDQARDNFARAQELYDQQKYAAGDRALARAQQREAKGLALANAQITASSALRTQAREDLTLPGEMRKQQLGLSVLEQTAPFAGRQAEATLGLTRSQAERQRAEAASLAAGGRNAGGMQTKPMTGPGMKGSVEGADSIVMAANSAGYQIIGPDGRPIPKEVQQAKAQISSMLARGLVANYITDPVSKKIILVPYGMQPQLMTPAPQGQVPGRQPDFSFNQIVNPD